ncbi:MAG: hypothetical protein DRI36_04600 [Caldiserica bacterium]|nr:MAG: hypothetical protein DRI36_04600 [Caldisericota bacterium]
MKKILLILNELKKKKIIVDYAICGAVATLRWAEPIFTQDLDILVVLPEHIERGKILDLSSIYNFLKSMGYSKWIGQWILVENIPVEFIPADEISKEAVKKAARVKFEGVYTKVIKPEYLIVMFLIAGRDKDIMKINLLLREAKIEMRKLNSLLKKYGLIKKWNEYVRCGRIEKY